jgi:hypothetical protein
LASFVRFFWRSSASSLCQLSNIKHVFDSETRRLLLARKLQQLRASSTLMATRKALQVSRKAICFVLIHRFGFWGELPLSLMDFCCVVASERVGSPQLHLADTIMASSINRTTHCIPKERRSNRNLTHLIIVMSEEGHRRAVSEPPAASKIAFFGSKTKSFLSTIAIIPSR